MTHADLVTRAARWLKNSKRCTVVMVETGCWLTRIPDAIGWDWKGNSIAVECKVSVSDFKRDALKRMPIVGRRFYYMAPAGLLTRQDVGAWNGLLEVHGRQVRVAKEATRREGYSSSIEVPLLVAEIRRVAVVEGGRARLFVEPMGVEA